MKKVTVATVAGRESPTLEQLRDLGVLHVHHVRKPEAPDLEILEKQIAGCDRALDVLASRKNKGGAPSSKAALEIASEVFSLLDRRARSQNLLQTIEDGIDTLSSLGVVSGRTLSDLKNHGVHVKIYRAERAQLEKVPIPMPHEILPAGRSSRYVLAAGDRDFSLPFEEVRIPEKRIDELREKSKAVRRELQDIDNQLNAYGGAAPQLRKEARLLRERLEFERVRFGMGRSESVSYLQGFCPFDEVDRLRKCSRAGGWGLLVQDPGEDDPIPTLIRNPPWVRMIRPVFKMMGTVPGYREYDMSLWFLGSLCIFFAMLIGDAGYGVLFLLATVVAKHLLKSAPKELFRLLMVLSTADIIWGTLTGTWFGLERVTQVPLLNQLIIPSLNAYSDNQQFMINLCFLLGAIHLTIAHLMRVSRFFHSLEALAEIGWIWIVWFLYFLACHLVLGKGLPPLSLFLLVGGIFLASSFANPHRHFLKSFVLAFSDLPLNVVRSFSDVVSYLRLFAVGYATLVVAMSFNHMAAGLGWDNLLSGLGATFVLLVGHGLNIILGAMAVLVHGVRLNMLEFSSHLEMTWSGQEYKPFKRSIVVEELQGRSES